MAGTKLLRGHHSVFTFFPEASSNWEAPTPEELNDALELGLGFDISCALEDASVAIGLTDSDTDDSISICDIAQVATPTFFNYEVEFDSFRNGPETEEALTPVYELPVMLFSNAGLPYYIVRRVGPPQGEAFAAGQTINIFGVDTDYPADILGDNSMIMFGSRFKPNGQVNTNYKLV